MQKTCENCVHHRTRYSWLCCHNCTRNPKQRGKERADKWSDKSTWENLS